MDPIDERVNDDIKQHGWHVAKIEGDDKAPPWAFTIGFQDSFDHPEVFVAGMPLDQLHALLNRIGDLLRSGNCFGADDTVHNILEDFACAFKDVAPCWQQVFAGNAAWHHRDTELRLLQCFWPDPDGRFPWNEGFPADLMALQPLLYEEDPEVALAPSLKAVLVEEGAL